VQVAVAEGRTPRCAQRGHRVFIARDRLETLDARLRRGREQSTRSSSRSSRSNAIIAHSRPRPRRLSREYEVEFVGRRSATDHGTGGARDFASGATADVAGLRHPVVSSVADVLTLLGSASATRWTYGRRRDGQSRPGRCGRPAEPVAERPDGAGSGGPTSSGSTSDRRRHLRRRRMRPDVRHPGAIHLLPILEPSVVANCTTTSWQVDPSVEATESPSSASPTAEAQVRSHPPPPCPGRTGDGRAAHGPVLRDGPCAARHFSGWSAATTGSSGSTAVVADAERWIHRCWRQAGVRRTSTAHAGRPLPRPQRTGPAALLFGDPAAPPAASTADRAHPRPAPDRSDRTGDDGPCTRSDGPADGPIARRLRSSGEYRITRPEPMSRCSPLARYALTRLAGDWALDFDRPRTRWDCVAGHYAELRERWFDLRATWRVQVRPGVHRPAACDAPGAVRDEVRRRGSPAPLAARSGPPGTMAYGDDPAPRGRADATMGTGRVPSTTRSSAASSNATKTSSRPDHSPRRSR
jgi:hypothetical protein